MMMIKNATLLLLVVTHTHALPWSNMCGPGGPEGAGSTGEPHDGYHIRTLDASKSWDAQIKLADGTTVQNQLVVKDAPQGADPVSVDPANGISGTGEKTWPAIGWGKATNYTLNTKTNLWDIPQDFNNYKNAGYPSNTLEPSYKWNFVSTMQDAGNRDSADGLRVVTADQKSGQAGTGYKKFSEGKDYMLFYFGAQWSPECTEFTPRFSQYYKAQDKNAQGKKFDVVYVGHESHPAQFDAVRKTMPFPALPYDASFSIFNERLKDVMGAHSVPMVVVVNKAGEVVTTQGVQAIKGEENDGKYPLASAPELFQDEVILPVQDGSSLETEQQRKEIWEALEADIATMNDEQLKQLAASKSIVIPAGTSDLKAFMRTTLKQSLDAATKEQVQEMYEVKEQQEEKPSNYHFEEGQYIRVKESFMSDPETLGGSTSSVPKVAIPYGQQQGSRNIGKIMAVTEESHGNIEAGTDTKGAIKVQFMDNKYARRWILPEHFEHIEQISQEEARREGCDL